MNKYLMLTAATALVATGAQAGTEKGTFQFGTAGGGSYCDGGTAYTSGASVWSWTHTNNNCSGGTSYGQGLFGKAGGIKGANMSDTLYGQNYGIFSEYVSFVLPKKLKDGAPWELYVGISGTTSFLGNSGVLINTGAPAHKGGKHSTVAGLKQLIQLHKKS